MDNKIRKCPKCNSQNVVASTGSGFATGKEDAIPKVFENHHLCGNCGQVFSDNSLSEKLGDLHALFTLKGHKLLIERVKHEKVILKVANIKKETLGVFEFKGDEEITKAEEYYNACIIDK